MSVKLPGDGPEAVADAEAQTEITSEAAAQAFWRSAIGVYTSGHFDELVVADERWHGCVQRFVS